MAIAACLRGLTTSDVTYSAYFESINPFEPTSVTNYPIVNVGFFESVPIVAADEWIFYGGHTR